MNPNRQQIISYKIRVLAQLADGLAPVAESVAIRKGLHLMGDTLFDMAIEIANLEPEESDLKQVLAKLHARRSAHPLSRS